jgi:predicted nucleic acid-binding protein
VQAEVFLDAAYAIALSSPSDQYHDRAMEMRVRMKIEKTRLVTTQGVVLEIGNALSKQRYRDAAIRLVSSLFTDPNVEVVLLSPELFIRAFQLYTDRTDKEWGLTDCVSFVVMADRAILEALTADEHFQQAGFLSMLQMT